jgi:hypothetical protein
MTGSLDEATDETELSAYDFNIAAPAVATIVLFASGLGLTIIYAADALL